MFFAFVVAGLQTGAVSKSRVNKGGSLLRPTHRPYVHQAQKNGAIPPRHSGLLSNP